MKDLKFISVILILILSATVKTYSQGRMTFGLGTAIPTGDFAVNDIADEEAGGAGVGLNLDFYYIYSFQENGLGIFGGLNICYNPLSGQMQSDVRKEFESIGIQNATYKFYSYFNIPVSAGFNYTQQIKKNAFLFTNMGLAADYLKITDMVISANGQEVTMTSEPNVKLGIKIGGGIQFGRNSISVNYLGLGRHKIKSTISSGTNSQDIEGKQKVGIIAITLNITI
jgi:hypothetical protein